MNIGLFSLFGCMVLIIVGFCVYMLKKGKLNLLHILYFVISGITVVWLMALMALMFFEGDATAEYIIDALTNVAVFLATLALLVSLSFALNWETLPRWCALLFVVPLFSFIMVWTNPLHHLHYKVFSIDINQIEFGPLVMVSGLYSYICALASIFVIVHFVIRSKRSIYRRQAILLILGNLIAICGSMLTTLGLFDFNLFTVPLFYIFGFVLMHGYAIFKFHILDIKHIATETVISRISDGYLVVSNEGLIVNLNKAFADSFGVVYKLNLNTNLYDITFDGEYTDDVGMHTLVASMKNATSLGSTISYEQSLTLPVNGKPVSKFYMVDVTQLIVNTKIAGFVIFFKDITQLKENARDLHNSQKRLMEQERLASLGQMVGGISHNLKTPIMSISGSVNTIDKLIAESAASLGDPDVTTEDFREIYAEMNQWTSRIQEACTYMSDIITAVKGQAANMSANDDNEFTIDTVIKRVMLLLRHELQSFNCTLKETHLSDEPVKIRGDINSLVQVLNNLVDNAIYAMKETGGVVEIETEKNEETFFIRVKDSGPGIPEDVKKVLFSQMITSKGAMGTGLGLFISNSFIKARFDGSIGFDDNPGGGTVFTISLPLIHVGAKS